MKKTAAKVKAGERANGAKDFNGCVFQAKAYEGLTCNALEWVGGHGGGTVVNANGEITIRNAEAAKALNLAASWIGTISPTGVLNYEEEEGRGVFQNANALFMRNWPYAWSLLQKNDSLVKGKVGVAKLPGNPSAAALGGWQLGVSKYSKHQAIAADLVMYMTSAAVQKSRAIHGSFNPTLPALYKDKDVLEANEFMGALADVFANSVARHTTATGLKYPQVRQSFWNAAPEVLFKRAPGDIALATVASSSKQHKRQHW